MATTAALSASLSLAGGGLSGAAVTVTGGAELVGTNNGGTLSGVPPNGPLDLSQQNNANLTVYGGLTLNGTLSLGAADGSTDGRIYFGDGNGNAAGALGGAATVVFGGSGSNGLYDQSNVAGTPGQFTLAAGVVVHGSSGQVGAGSGPASSRGAAATPSWPRRGRQARQPPHPPQPLIRHRAEHREPTPDAVHDVHVVHCGA